jgi:hypothetical protein
MGRGNVCVFGDYEGLYYVDRGYIDCYVAKDMNEYGEYEEKMYCDLEVEDFCDYDYSYTLSSLYYEDFIRDFTDMMKKKFKSFVVTLVSSAAIKTTIPRVSIPRGEKSDKFPIGVPTTYNLPLICPFPFYIFL